MVSGSMSGCINHPGIEATARCKQCGKPVCDSCVVRGPTGQFCSESCKDRHQKFIERAQEMQRNSKPTGGLRKIKILVVKLIILIAALALLGYGAIQFDIPVANDIARKVYGVVAPFLGF